MTKHSGLPLMGAVALWTAIGTITALAELCPNRPDSTNRGQCCGQSAYCEQCEPNLSDNSVPALSLGRHLLLMLE